MGTGTGTDIAATAIAMPTAFADSSLFCFSPSLLPEAWRASLADVPGSPGVGLSGAGSAIPDRICAKLAGDAAAETVPEPFAAVPAEFEGGLTTASAEAIVTAGVECR
jgi:hypothetical protein